MAALDLRWRKEAQVSLRVHFIAAVCLRLPFASGTRPLSHLWDARHQARRLEPLGPAGRHMFSFQSQKRGPRKREKSLDRDAMPMLEQAVCPIHRSLPNVRLAGRRHVKGPTNVLQHGAWRTWANHWLSMDRLVSETRPAARRARQPRTARWTQHAV
jgi:hypothetical protein